MCAVYTAWSIAPTLYKKHTKNPHNLRAEGEQEEGRGARGARAGAPNFMIENGHYVTISDYKKTALKQP